MIEVKNISKKYDDIEVLKDINFKVKKGDFIGIIGKNGSGKTTLINILCKLIKQDSGKIEYSFPLKDIYSKIGVQTQLCEFDERLKVKDMTDLWKSIYNLDEEKIDNLLEKFELKESKNKYIKNLSGGQKQKLNILLAIVNDPEIIILDELTTALDAVSRYDMRKYLIDLNRSGKTIIMVSHYMDEVEELCNRLLVLKNGIIAENTTPVNLVGDDYKDLQDYFVKCM